MNEIGRPAREASRLSKDVVLNAALDLLDRGGDRAVTFRALARRLGVTPMAVAHHVGSRKEMFASLVARVYADVGDTPVATDPKERLRIMLARYCERVIAHPELALSVFSDPSLMTGRLADLTRSIEDTLSMTGAEPSDLSTLVGVVVDYTHGFALAAAASFHADVEPNDATTHLTLEDFRRGLDWILDATE